MIGAGGWGVANLPPGGPSVRGKPAEMSAGLHDSYTVADVSMEAASKESEISKLLSLGTIQPFLVSFSHLQPSSGGLFPQNIYLFGGHFRQNHQNLGPINP